MKAWLKGGLIGLVIGYIGYIIIFYFVTYSSFPKYGVFLTKPSLIGSIPSLSWFIIYSLIFFVIGALIGHYLSRRKK